MNPDEEKKMLTDLMDKVSKIERAILGDEAYKVKGVLQTLDEHKKRILDLEEFKKKIYWQATAIGAFASVLIELILQLKDYIK
jgi:hypothetical protein